METKGITKTATFTSLFTAALLVANVSMAKAEGESQVETSVGVDIVSQYIWRGTDCGGISIQPALGVSYGGLSLGAWGSWDGGDIREVDFTLGYAAGPLSVAVTDYWINSSEVPYFKYKKDETAHIFEGTVGLDLGIISLSWNTCFAGEDYKMDSEGEYKLKDNGKKKRAFSSYAEVAAPFSVGGIEWTATVGAATNESVMYGTSGFSITNISLGATKALKFSETYSMPVSCAVIANPHADKLYLVATISF